MNPVFDWKEFVSAANREFGTRDDDWYPYGQSAILSFNDPTRVCAKYNGRNVYPHTVSKDAIAIGDVWVCSLIPNGTTNYFAKGIKKLDASFFFELNKGDTDMVVDYIWEKNRDSIEPVLEAKYKATLQEQMARIVEENRKEDKEKIQELSEALSELQKVSQEDKATIKSLESSIEALKSSHESFAPQKGPQLSQVTTFVPWGQSDVVAPVHRIAPDALMSEGFTSSRYSVHMSSDHRSILVTPDANGNVLCISGTITLAGLDVISPFTGDVELSCSYSREYNGLLITLK